MKKKIIICLYLFGINIALYADTNCNECEKIAKKLFYFAKMISKPNFHQPKPIYNYLAKIMLSGKFDNCRVNDKHFKQIFYYSNPEVYKTLLDGLNPYRVKDSLRKKYHLNDFLVHYSYPYFMMGKFTSKWLSGCNGVVFHNPSSFMEFMRFKSKKERETIYDYIYGCNTDGYTNQELAENECPCSHGHSHSKLFEILKDYKHLKEMQNFYKLKQ